MRANLSGAGCKAVAQHQPDGPILAQDAPHLAEHRDEIGNVCFDGRLQAKLALDAIIAETPSTLRWGRDHGVNASTRKCFEHIAAVPDHDLDGHGNLLSPAPAAIIILSRDRLVA
jgi:hypothetical protein